MIGYGFTVPAPLRRRVGTCEVREYPDGSFWARQGTVSFPVPPMVLARLFAEAAL